MLKKRWLLVICAVLFICGCEKKDREPETYEFVDVLGNAYEAEILEDVPKCEYDYERLIDQDGYKYYTDKKGKITSKIGIDVSKYQEEVNWKKVKNAGMDFAIIRLGYRGYGESGRLVEDEYFKQNVEGALNAGLDVGVYFFSQAVSEEEAKEEAEFVLKKIKKYDITYPIVFDTEEVQDETARTNGIEKEIFTDSCIIFCDAVEKAGYDTMIYANMKWMAFTLDLDRLEDYDFWYADYENEPQCPYDFQMWQYTEDGKVPGVDGGVDLNVYFQ